jgi:hypothetical protein
MKSRNRFILIIIFFGIGLVVFGQPLDTLAPSVHSITFSPNTINGGDSIDIWINITDDFSGIKHIQIDIANAAKTQNQTVSAYIDDWATLVSDMYNKKFELNPFAAGGEWHIESMYVQDNALNMLFLDDSASTIATFSVLPSATSDGEAPQLNNIFFTPANIGNGDSITVTVDAQDNLSGISNIQVDIVNPDGGQEQSSSSLETEWMPLGGNLYSNKFKISDWAMDGEWYVSGIFIHDSANNVFYVGDSLPTIASFHVTSTSPDGSVPVFDTMFIEIPQGVLFPANGDSLNIIIDIFDEGSGLDKIQVDVASPNGQQEYSTYTTSVDSTWTALGNNRYSKWLTIINEFAVSGEWFVSSVFAYDKSGNYLFLDGNDSTLATFCVSGVGPPPACMP